MTKLLDSVQVELLHRFAEEQLNEVEKEQVKILLRRFVRGEMDDVESNRVMTIIGEHDHCIELLESIWMEEPIGQALASTPLPDIETSERLKEQIGRAIQRADAAGMAIKFGISGFGAVASSLLRPFIKQNQWKNRRSRRNRR